MFSGWLWQGLESLRRHFQAGLEGATREHSGSSIKLLSLQCVLKGMGTGGEGELKISIQVPYDSMKPNPPRVVGEKAFSLLCRVSVTPQIASHGCD